MSKDNISPAEWEIMRIVWTIGSTTSKELINILGKKQNWSASTIKTLLSRLCEKNFLNISKDGRKNIYSSSVNEQEEYQFTAMKLFENICCMHYGETLNSLINDLTLSKNDIDLLLNTLQDKRKTAPENVSCNCLNKKQGGGLN